MARHHLLDSGTIEAVKGTENGIVPRSLEKESIGHMK
jgi:hypothetical protein